MPSAAANNMVTDVITLERIPRSKAVQLNRQWYDPVQLLRWLRTGSSVVPHSRRTLTASEVQNIRRAAGIPNARTLTANEVQNIRRAAGIPNARRRYNTPPRRSVGLLRPRQVHGPAPQRPPAQPRRPLFSSNRRYSAAAVFFGRPPSGNNNAWLRLIGSTRP